MRANYFFASLLAFIPSIILGQSMSGHYSVGTNSSDYTTLTQAKNDLLNKGMSGNVYLDLAPGVYNEQVRFKQINRSSTTDTLFIRNPFPKKGDVKFETSKQTADSNFVLAFATQKPTIVSNIKFVSKGSAYCGGIEILSNASNLTIENCDFTSPVLSATSTTKYHIYTKTTVQFDNVTIKGCSLKGGDKGIYLHTLINPAKGNNRIINCEIDSFYSNGIDITNQKNGEIKGCQIISKADIGILLASTIDSFEIARNIIRGDFKKGVDITHSSVSSKTTNIVNNIISVVSGYGLHFQGGKNFHIYHNSIYNNSSSKSSIDLINVSNYEIKNNIFYNGGSHYSASYPNLNGVEISNNLYYSNGSSFAAHQSVPISSMTTLQSIANNPPIGTNGLNYNPDYANFDNLEFKCSTHDTVRTSSIIPGITSDVCGLTRSAKPFRGAVEAIASDGTQMTSYFGYVHDGTDTLKHGKVLLIAENDENRLVLDTIEEATIVNGKFTFSNVPAYRHLLKIIPDKASAPDYVACYHNQEKGFEGITYLKAPSCNYTLDVKPLKIISLGTGPNSISGTIILNTTGKTTNPIPGLDVVLDKVPPGKSVASTKTDANGNYSFNNLPIGTYQILVDYPGVGLDTLHNVDIATDGTAITKVDYCVDTIKSIDVCSQANSVIPVLYSSVSLYPNPVSNELNVQIPEGSWNVKVISVAGKEVYNSNLKEGNQKIYLGNLSEGVYTIVLVGENSILQNRILKLK